MKRAADANTVDMAKDELKTVIDYLDAHNMTEGYTSILWTTPDADVGFWYKNITTSYDELCSLSDTASGLERSNMLIKLRETLIDHGGEGGDSVTQPSGIAIFPNNVMYAWWGWGSIILTLLFGWAWVRKHDIL